MSFADLPLEILCAIAASLDTKDAIRFSGVNRDIRQGVHESVQYLELSELNSVALAGNVANLVCQFLSLRSLRCGKITVAELQRIAKMPQLNTLEYDHELVGDSPLDLPTLHLESLTIQNFNLDSNVALFPHLFCSSLTALDLYRTITTRHAASVESDILDYACGHLPSLTALGTYGSPEDNSTNIIQILNKLEHLRSLRLRTCPMEIEFLELTRPLVLERLSLLYPEMFCEVMSMASLCEKAGSNLKRVELPSDCLDIGGVGVEPVDYFPKYCPNLELGLFESTPFRRVLNVLPSFNHMLELRLDAISSLQIPQLRLVCPLLETLHASSLRNVVKDGFSCLHLLSTFPCLTRIKVSELRRANAQDIVALSNKSWLATLKYLVIDDTRRRSGVEELIYETWRHMPLAEEVYADGSADVDMNELARCCPLLQDVTIHPLQSVPFSGSLPHLRQLHFTVSEEMVTENEDTGEIPQLSISYLESVVSGCPSLTSLQIDACVDLSDAESVVSLLSQCPRLNKLELTEMKQLPAASLIALLKHRTLSSFRVDEPVQVEITEELVAAVRDSYHLQTFIMQPSNIRNECFGDLGTLEGQLLEAFEELLALPYQIEISFDPYEETDEGTGSYSSSDDGHSYMSDQDSEEDDTTDSDDEDDEDEDDDDRDKPARQDKWQKKYFAGWNESSDDGDGDAATPPPGTAPAPLSTQLARMLEGERIEKRVDRFLRAPKKPQIKKDRGEDDDEGSTDAILQALKALSSGKKSKTPKTSASDPPVSLPVNDEEEGEWEDDDGEWEDTDE